MKNNKTLLLAALTMLVTSCVPKPDKNKDNQGNNNNNTDSSSVEEVVAQEEDIIGLIPSEVLNYKGEIDILTYIEGQNGTAVDIGKPEDFTGGLTPQDILTDEMARYVAAAREFKKLAPGVKINFIYCSIDEYNDRIINYREKKGHLPHIMHPVDNFYEMLENGMVTDLSIYKDTEYFKSISSSLLADCTFGDFVAAFPTHYAPYGMFVNKNILDKHYIVDTTDDEEYQKWIDDLTFEKYIDVCKDTYDTGVNAGFTKMFDIMSSYMYQDVYYDYIMGEDHELNLNTNSVKELIENEALLEQYSCYDYPEKTIKAEFPEVKVWNIAQSFVNGYFTFNTEMPWNIGEISQLAIKANKSYKDFDYMPYPKSSEDSDTIYGNAVGGVQIGNLCPIDENGDAKPYSATAELERDVAAYFAMFMVADPRAIKAKSEIQFMTADELMKGYVSLPMSKKDYRFSYQDDDEILAKLGGDPTEGYSNVFEYELALYLKTYPLYFDSSVNNGEPDVINYSNVSYGLMKIINAVTDESGNSKVANYRHFPQNVLIAGVLEDIMYNWINRYDMYELGTETYVANLTDALTEIEDKVNEYTETALEYLQEMVDLFYGEGYTVV